MRASRTLNAMATTTTRRCRRRFPSRQRQPSHFQAMIQRAADAVVCRATPNVCGALEQARRVAGCVSPASPRVGRVPIVWHRVDLASARVSLMDRYSGATVCDGDAIQRPRGRGAFNTRRISTSAPSREPPWSGDEDAVGWKWGGHAPARRGIEPRDRMRDAVSGAMLLRRPGRGPRDRSLPTLPRPANSTNPRSKRATPVREPTWSGTKSARVVRGWGPDQDARNREPFAWGSDAVTLENSGVHALGEMRRGEASSTPRPETCTSSSRAGIPTRS